MSRTITRLHHNRRTFSWNYKRVRITWPLTLTLSISWMKAHMGTIVCKFGSDPAILHGFWDTKLQRYWRHDFDIRVTWRHRSFDVTTGFPRCGFLLVVNMNRPCISHGCRDIELQRCLCHDLDLLGSRDVICYVTIGFAIPINDQLEPTIYIARLLAYTMDS